MNIHDKLSTHKIKKRQHTVLVRPIVHVHDNFQTIKILKMLVLINFCQSLYNYKIEVSSQTESHANLRPGYQVNSLTVNILYS